VQTEFQNSTTSSSLCDTHFAIKGREREKGVEGKKKRRGKKKGVKKNEKPSTCECFKLYLILSKISSTALFRPPAGEKAGKKREKKGEGKRNEVAAGHPLDLFVSASFDYLLDSASPQRGKGGKQPSLGRGKGEKKGALWSRQNPLIGPSKLTGDRGKGEEIGLSKCRYLILHPCVNERKKGRG